jgi:integrase
VRGPKHVVKTGKTPVLEGKEWRRLIDTIPADTVRDLRDRALIATLTYGFARIGAALKMRVDDLQSKGSGWLIRLHEKGGKQHMMPCHHALEEALHAYIAAAGIAADNKGFLFRTARGHTGTELSNRPMTHVINVGPTRSRVRGLLIFDLDRHRVLTGQRCIFLNGSLRRIEPFDRTVRRV